MNSAPLFLEPLNFSQFCLFNMNMETMTNISLFCSVIYHTFTFIGYQISYSNTSNAIPYPMAVYARSVSLLAYPTIVYARSM